MRVGHPATDHHKIKPVRKPLVTKRGKLVEVSPKCFERLDCVREITAECFVLRVTDAKPAAAAAPTRLTRFDPLAKWSAPRQQAHRFEIGVLPECLGKYRDQILRQGAIPRGAFQSLTCQGRELNGGDDGQ